MRYGYADALGYGYCESCKPETATQRFTAEKEDRCESCGGEFRPVCAFEGGSVEQTVCRIF